MKSPKILPWLARKAGISDARTEALWHKAVRHATLTTEWVNSPEYWRVAMEKLEELVEAEGNQVCRPRFTPIVRAQHDLGDLQITAWEGMMRAANEAWSRMVVGAR